jgi:hypothetical protein
MPRRKKTTTVTAQIPSTVDLTKLKSKNALRIEIRRGMDLLGTLSMGRGSVEWWPRGNKTHILRKRWRAFADMLDEHMK